MRIRKIEKLIISQRNNIVPDVLDKVKARIDYKKEKFNFFNFAFKPLIAAFSILIIVLSIVFGNNYANKEMSTVYLDINPSFGLVISNNLKIIDVIEPENQSISKEIKLVGKTFEQAVLQIINFAITNGLIKDNEENALSIAAFENDEKGKKIVNNLKPKIEKFFQDKSINCEIYEDSFTQNIKNEADSLNYSPGKLILIKRLMELDDNLRFVDLKDKTMKELNDLLKEYLKSAVVDSNNKGNSDNNSNNSNNSNNGNANNN